MSLSDLASLGSFVSGVAVFVSFIFLALQLRQSNLNQRALVQEARAARVVDSIFRQAEPHLSGIMFRGRKGDTSMQSEEVESFLQSTYASFLNFEDTYLQARAGMIDPAAWNVASVRLANYFRTPGWRISWHRARKDFGSEYAAAIDQILKRASRTPADDPAQKWAADVAAEQALLAAN